MLDAVQVPTGVFFARVRHEGKLFRRSLETDVFTTAKLRLPNTVFNNTVKTLRRILALAGLGHDANPAMKLERLGMGNVFELKFV